MIYWAIVWPIILNIIWALWSFFLIHEHKKFRSLMEKIVEMNRARINELVTENSNLKTAYLNILLKQQEYNLLNPSENKS